MSSKSSSRLACLIPARGGSKRFPRKNIALLRGKPLLGRTIEAATGSGLFPEVWVSTDDAEVASVAKEYGAQVHDRSTQLASDTATLTDVCLDFIRWLEKNGRVPEVLCLILPTAGFMRPEDLQKGYALLQERQADYSMAVTTYLEPPFWALKEENGFLKSFFGKEYLVASQKLPQVWVDSGYFYFARVEAFRRERTLYGEKVVGHKIPRERSVDIDEPGHLLMAEAILEVLERKEAEVR